MALIEPRKTPQSREVERVVGIRELRDSLSRHIRHAADGGEVVVTMHGRRVARLVPFSDRDPLDELRGRGLVEEPARPKRRARGRKRPKPSAPVSELVREQRR